MWAKRFETVFTPISSSFHHNYLIGWPNRFVDWDSRCNEKLRLHPSSLMKCITPCHCSYVRCHNSNSTNCACSVYAYIGHAAWAGWTFSNSFTAISSWISSSFHHNYLIGWPNCFLLIGTQDVMKIYYIPHPSQNVLHRTTVRCHTQ